MHRSIQNQKELEKSKKWAYCRKLDNVLLQSVNRAVSEPVALLFNACVQEKIFPKNLKLEKLLHLFSNYYYSTYTPKSLFAVLTKLFEKII